MQKRFPEYQTLDLPKINREIEAKWNTEKSFEKSLENQRRKTTLYIS